MKSFALAALIASTSAIAMHHHHHHHPSAQALLQDDPTCTTSQETGHCLLSHYKDEGKSDHPIDYFVPNFGVDEDIKASLQFTSDAETELAHPWIIPEGPAPAGPPKDYFVPNFGVDAEIKANNDNLALVEKKLKHKFVVPKSAAVRKNIAIPPAQLPENRVLDADVQTTLKNSENAEAALGTTWNIVWN